MPVPTIVTEKSVVVPSAAQGTGAAVATRKARSNDDVYSAEREIQLFDKATRHMPLLGVGFAEFDVQRQGSTYTYGTKMTNGVLSVGDVETLVACLKFSYDQSKESDVTMYSLDFGIKVIPIVVKDNASTTPEVLAVLPPHLFQPITPYIEFNEEAATPLYVEDGYNKYNITSLFSWPIMGANYLQFQLAYDAEDMSTVYPDIRLYTWGLSGKSNLEDIIFDDSARPAY
jgi:hypothetical protein